MKRVFTAGVMVAIVAMIFGSCAEKEASLAPQLARQTFDAWIAKNAPAASAYKDIYIEYIERGPAGAVQPARDNSWLLLDYTGKILDGTVFVTRTDSISKRIGQYAYTTHFASDFTKYTVNSEKLCVGLQQALEAMRVGDSVRVYIPADKAYKTGMILNGGYAGESGVTYVAKPVVFTMRLNGSVIDPFIWERDSAERYAKQHWGTDYVRDTTGLYVHIANRNPSGAVITKDSAVYAYYALYFMDGFLAETNIDTIALEFNVYGLKESDSYDPLALSLSLTDDIQIHRAIYEAALHMRYGETAEVVTVSAWVYGDAGNSANTPEFLPYQPMFYRIYIPPLE